MKSGALIGLRRVKREPKGLVIPMFDKSITGPTGRFDYILFFKFYLRFSQIHESDRFKILGLSGRLFIFFCLWASWSLITNFFVCGPSGRLLLIFWFCRPPGRLFLIFGL